MRHSPLLFVFPLFLLACSATPPAPEAVEQQPAPIVKRDFSTVLEENFRGQLSIGGGKGYFKGCGTDEEFTVDVSSAINTLYDRIASTPYTPVYIEFTGEITFASPSLSDDGALLRIDNVHHMALAKASLQCAKPVHNFLFKASGDNPYWRINIDNGQLLFSTKANNQAYNIKTSNFRTTQTSRINSISKNGQKLELAIQPGQCYNMKNKEYWGFTTTVNSLWGKFSGCGEPGWPSVDHPFDGFYLSSDNTTTNLVLNSNYTAEYSTTVDNKKVVKQGYWKTNTPDRLVLMLTKEGDEDIRQEIIFERNNLSLNATELNDNNIVNTIAGGTLNFKKMNAEQVTEVVATPAHISRQFAAQNISPETMLDAEVQKAVNNYFKIHRTDPKNTQFSSVKYDLNDDGIDDAIVLLDWCSDKNGCEMLIFKGRKQAGYSFSSRISRIHAPILVSKTQYYRWQSLLIKKGSGWAALTFDGISYPIHTRDLELVNKEDNSTGVILFSAGKPTQWFPVKM